MMRLIKRWTILSLIFWVILSFASCEGTSDSNSKAEAATEVAIEDKEHNSKYICPMYCEGSGSTEAGDCPVCHMHYVENEEYQAPK